MSPSPTINSLGSGKYIVNLKGPVFFPFLDAPPSAELFSQDPSSE